MSRTDKWMLLYVGDYPNDAAHLTTIEDGAYLVLLMHAWSHGGAVPSDGERLRSKTKMDSDSWARSQATLAAEVGRWPA